jgi:hypothetical protein
VVETIAERTASDVKDVDIEREDRIERMAKRMTRMMIKEIARATGIPLEKTRAAPARIDNKEVGLLRDLERASTIEGVMDIYIKTPIGGAGSV